MVVQPSKSGKEKGKGLARRTGRTGERARQRGRGKFSFLARTGVKRQRSCIREEDSNYRSGTENAGFHQTLRGTILDKYSCFRIASMPPLLPLSHFIGTGNAKNLLAPTRARIVQVYLQKIEKRRCSLLLPHPLSLRAKNAAILAAIRGH